MLRIRDSQFQVLNVSLADSFVERVETYLRKCHAPAVEPLSRSVFQRRVDTALRRAEAYGLEHESAIVSFVALMFELAPNFDEHPAFAKMLNEPMGEDQHGFVRRLVTEATADDWYTAWASYDESAWRRNERAPVFGTAETA